VQTWVGESVETGGNPRNKERKMSKTNDLVIKWAAAVVASREAREAAKLDPTEAAAARAWTAFEAAEAAWASVEAAATEERSGR
jgi:hypothetical protein